jgi:hypothetical protein
MVIQVLYLIDAHEYERTRSLVRTAIRTPSNFRRVASRPSSCGTCSRWPPLSLASPPICRRRHFPAALARPALTGFHLVVTPARA